MGHHPGDTVAQTVGSNASMSPLAWMMIIASLVIIGYLFYWIFTKDAKKW